MKRKILMIGDNKNSKWHPLKGFDAVISSIFTEDEITISDDDQQLNKSVISSYDACIILLDQWEVLDSGKVEGIHSFVREGKGVLMIHQGISLQVNSSLCSLIGGKFTGHPEQKLLRYILVKNRFSLGTGINYFEAIEEPYRCEIDPLSNPEVIMQYDDDQGVSIPAGWAHHYGLGKVCYLSPGHRIETFYLEEYRLLIKQAIDWLTTK